MCTLGFLFVCLLDDIKSLCVLILLDILLPYPGSVVIVDVGSMPSL